MTSCGQKLWCLENMTNYDGGKTNKIFYQTNKILKTTSHHMWTPPKNPKTRWKLKYKIFFIIYFSNLSFRTFNNLTQSFSFALLHNLKIRKLAFFYSSFAIKLVLANKNAGRKVAWIKPFVCRRSYSFRKKKDENFCYYFDYGFHLCSSHILCLISRIFLFDPTFFRQCRTTFLIYILIKSFSFRWLYWWTFFLQHFFLFITVTEGTKTSFGRSCTKKRFKN